MKIYYVRHGQTDWNLARKMQGGGTEKELNSTGIEQANETKKELENAKYDIVICSPMHRAMQTAEIINKDKNVQMITDERIRERRLGKLEGHEITDEMEKRIWNYDLNYQIPEGENLHDFEKRILDFLDDIKKKYEGKTILIVAHGGVAKVLKVDHEQFTFERYNENESIMVIVSRTHHITKVNLPEEYKDGEIVAKLKGCTKQELKPFGAIAVRKTK